VSAPIPKPTCASVDKNALLNARLMAAATYPSRAMLLLAPGAERFPPLDLA